MKRQVNTVPDSHPWTLFADEAIIRSEPREDSEELGRLRAGESVSGSIVVNADTNEEWLAFDRENRHCFATLSAMLRIHPGNRPTGNLEIGTEFINRWWGIPLQYEPDDLVELPKRLIIEDGKAYRLRRAALVAVTRLIDAAAKDGIIIRVASTYRSGLYQRGLFEKACERDGRGQRYSARPGHSEHQLGTAVDLTDPEEKFAFEHSFQDGPQGKWLEANAGQFGFVRSYTDYNIAETGYISEPWHWRYWGEAAADR